MNTEQAKKIPLSKIMERLGFIPVKVEKNGSDIWYNSPFRNEKESSFHINIIKNIWYDFGLGKGGTVIDFGQEMINGNVSASLQYLEQFSSIPKTSFKYTQATSNNNINHNEASNFSLVKATEIQSPALKRYLKERCISINTADKFLKEVHFENTNGKQYYGLGIENKSGGFEVRNKFMKASVGQKNISIIQGEIPQNEISVFEGFFDFLSYVEDKKLSVDGVGDNIILNSLSFHQQAINFIKDGNYERTYTYFDNDVSGEKATDKFFEELLTVTPKNKIYQPHQDYNEYLQEINRSKSMSR